MAGGAIVESAEAACIVGRILAKKKRPEDDGPLHQISFQIGWYCFMCIYSTTLLYYLSLKSRL